MSDTVSREIEAGSQVASYACDGHNRRVVRTVSHSADRNAVCHDYYNGWSVIETGRFISTQSGDVYAVLKQNVRGLQYIDELVQVAVNIDPENAATGVSTENICERFFWTLQDVNWNVLGVVNAAG